MNLSRERMAFIRGQVERGEQLDREAAEDLQGHNDHLTQLCEAKGRLLMKPEADGDLSYALILAERRQLKAENESLRKDAERWRFVRNPVGNGSPFAIWSERRNLFLGKYADEAIDSAMSQATQPLNPA